MRLFGDASGKHNSLLSTVVSLLRIRNFKRTFFGLISLTLLIMYWLWPQNSPVTSAVACKNKIAKMVIPRDSEREKFFGTMGNDPVSLENEFFHYVSTQTQQCYDQVHLGPQEDGGWEVCVYGSLNLQPPCLIYSFGVGHDLRFEKAAEQLFGCEVHAFDPSMGVKSHAYSNKGFFHDYGIDFQDGYSASGSWQLKRLITIMEELGHTGKTIDYLKMDIEFSEWPALYDIMNTGIIQQVRQLALEVHTPEVDIHDRPEHPCTWSNRDTMAFMLRILLELRDLGFNVYYSRTNYRTKFTSPISGMERYCCHDLHFINTKHETNRRPFPR